MNCSIYRAVIIWIIINTVAVDLTAQRFSLSAYFGREAEIITETLGIRIEDAMLTPNSQASYLWVPGVRIYYSVNGFLKMGFDAHYRPRYSYSYLIRVPDPRSPDGFVSSPSGRAIEEINLSLIPQLTIWQIGNLQMDALVGVGITLPFPSIGEGGYFDFGEGKELQTTIFNALREHSHKPTLTGQVGILVGWKRLFLQIRYLRTLSRSATDPLQINGRSYPYINKRDGLGLSVGYVLPIGRNRIDHHAFQR